MQTLSLAESSIQKGKLVTCSFIPGNIWNLSHQIFLHEEIFKHYPRLCKISGLTSEQVRESEFQVCKDITFISPEQINQSTWLFAEKLVADVATNDIHYVAYSKHFRCKIWSGDKELMNGLAKKGFTNFITTDELFKWRQKKEEKG